MKPSRIFSRIQPQRLMAKPWQSFTRPFCSNLIVCQEQQSITEERPPVPEIVRKRSRFTVSRPMEKLKNWELERLRVVPISSNFYGGNPVHDDNMYRLNSIIAKYADLPTRVVDAAEAESYKFVSLLEYRTLTKSGSRIRVGHHKALVAALNRLRSIDVELMPREVTEILKQFSSATRETKNSQKKSVPSLDCFGRAITVGKRKTCTSRISMVRGDGQVIINGRSFVSYFPRDSDREKIAYPFKVVSQEGKYNLFVEVSGGGISGQAEATMYGIAKALVIFNPLLKPRLRAAGLMTRDARIVERKKPGKVKARKSPTWVKR